MHLSLKIRIGMANSVDLDQTAPSGSLIWVCTVCICHFIRNFGVRIFRTFTVHGYFVGILKVFLQDWYSTTIAGIQSKDRV